MDDDDQNVSDSSSSSDSSPDSNSNSSSDSGNDSSSSDDSSSGQNQSVQLSEDDVADALTSAFEARDVPIEDGSVKVTMKSPGYFDLGVRLSADAKILPQVPDDTSNLPPGSVQGAMYLIVGAVQVLDGACRVTMRVTSVETSEILEAGKGDASGSTKDAVQAAAEDALAGLPGVGAT